MAEAAPAAEEKHFPGQQEAETPADEPAPEGAAPEGEQPKPEGEDAKPKPGDEPKPEQKPEAAKPDDPPAPTLPKKRSIYDDLKETRQERNEWKDAATAALKAAGIELKGNETPEQLQALIQEHKPAPKPDASAAPAPSKPAAGKPADDLAAYAEENGLDATALSRLAEIIAKRIPAASLSAEEKQDLAELKTWRTQQARTTEDNEVLATAPTVKTQLNITDDAELASVMKEVVRLSHTPEFHDKEVEYIVWKSQQQLAKLVSPKKPSFEQGGQPGDAGAEAAVDFSKGGVTPEMAGKAMQEKRGSALEIRPLK